MSSQTEIDDRQAQDDLESVRQTMAKTKRALNASYASPMLILWGILWVAAYTACHFYLSYASHIFTVMNVIGGLGSGFIVWWYHRKSPLKVKSANPIGRKVFWFWIFLIIYLGIWLAILSPFNGLQLNVTIVTAVMFAYVVMGLFYDSRFLGVLGVGVTAAALLAYYVFPAYYCLWIAVCGGGALLSTGIYIRLRWK